MSPVSWGAASGGRSRKDLSVRYGKTPRKVRTDRDWSPAAGFVRELVFRCAVVQDFGGDGPAQEDSMPGQRLSTRLKGISRTKVTPHL